MENEQSNQLSILFQDISKQFQVDVRSPKDLYNYINSLNKSTHNYKYACRKLQNENRAIKDRLETISADYNEKRNQKNDFKAKINEYSNLITKQNILLEEKSTKNNEILADLEEALTENKKLKSENAKLMQKISDYESKNNESKICNENFDINDNLENEIKQQNETIVELTNQRNTLFERLIQLTKVLEETDNSVKKIIDDKNDKLNILQDQVQMLMDKENNLIKKAQEMAPDWLNENNDVLGIISALYEENEKIKKDNSIENDSKMKEKYDFLLQQLEGTMKFLMNIVNSEQGSLDVSSPLNCNKENITKIKLMCSKIIQFLNSNELKLSNYSSIFNTDEIQECLNHMDEIFDKEIEEPKFRDIYVLLVGVVCVNEFQSKYLDMYKQKIKDIKQNKIIAEEIKTLEEQLEELKDWKSKIENKFKDVSQILVNPPEDLNELIDTFINEYKTILKTNETLKNKIEELKTKSIQDNDILNKLGKELESIEHEISLEKDNNIKKIKLLNEEIIKRDETIKELKIINKSNLDKLYKQKDTLSDFEKAQNETTELKNKIYDKILELENENKSLLSNISKLTKFIKKQNIKLEEANQKVNKLKESNSLLKEQNKNLQSQYQILKDLKKANDNISKKYDKIKENLEIELQESNCLNEKLNKEKEEILEKNKLITKELTQLKTNERALKLKITTLQDKIQLQKLSNQAKENSQLIFQHFDSISKIDILQNEIDIVRKGINNLLMKYYNKTPNDNDSLNKVYSDLESCMNQYEDDKLLLKDAFQTKLMFCRKPNTTIFNTLTEFDQNNKKLLKENKCLQNELNITKQSLLKAKSSSEKIQNYIKEASTWESWALSIYYQTIDCAKPIQNPNELRYILEESFLSNIHHKEIIQKLNLLRVQKSILIKFPLIEKNKIPTKPTSLLPIIHLTIYLRRIQFNGGLSFNLKYQQQISKDNTNT